MSRKYCIIIAKYIPAFSNLIFKFPVSTPHYWWGIVWGGHTSFEETTRSRDIALWDFITMHYFMDSLYHECLSQSAILKRIKYILNVENKYNFFLWTGQETIWPDLLGEAYIVQVVLSTKEKRPVQGDLPLENQTGDGLWLQLKLNSTMYLGLVHSLVSCYICTALWIYLLR